MALPETDKEETILIVLEDLRRLFDEISRNYNQLKTRALGLIAGEVALVSFVFSGNGINVTKLSVTEIVFFGIGAVLLAVSFALFLWIVSTHQWEVPLDLKESKKLYRRFSSKLDWLENIKEDYENCIERCLRKTRSRSAAFNKALMTLSCGIIIMLVIRFTTQGG
jgi:hypothetical protein